MEHSCRGESPIKITKDVLARGFKFSATALIIYFLVKSPIQYVLTDWLGIHYIFSGAISGAVVTVLTFLPSEFWIFKGKLKKKAVL